MQTYRRPLEDYTSSPYDDVINNDNWDSQRLNHDIIKRADIVADNRPRYNNKNLHAKATTMPSTAQSDAHESLKISANIPVYRVRTKSKSTTQRAQRNTTTPHNAEYSTHRNKHRKTYQLKNRNQFAPRNTTSIATETVSSVTTSSSRFESQEANVTLPSASNHRQSYSGETPLEIATRRAPNGRRYRIRVVEANAMIAKSTEKSSNELTSSSPTAKSADNTDGESNEQPNYPAGAVGKL